MAFKSPLDQAASLVANTTNKYNLVPTDQIRPTRQGSLSQEIKSIYDNMSDMYGVDLNDLVYGDKGFMKTKYPGGFPDFAGDVVYSDKHWNEFSNWAKENKGIDFDDREWERYKLDPDWFEDSHTPEHYKKVREYGKGIEPDHPIHLRPIKEVWW